MGEFKKLCLRIRWTTLLLVFLFHEARTFIKPSFAQSIGFHPQLNLGFNPYLSPIYGYGLGVPFGAYNFSPSRYPWLLSSISNGPYTDGSGFMGKIHAKAFLKKLAVGQYSVYHHQGTLKDKLNLMKHPEYAFTPYGQGYGYGKHYGAAVGPNNPYKSVYADYYDTTTDHGHRPDVKPANDLVTLATSHSPIASGAPVYKPYIHIKPLIKLGTLLTTAALLGKKTFEGPMRLNPSGMILSGTQS